MNFDGNAVTILGGHHPRHSTEKRCGILAMVEEEHLPLNRFDA
jgi:hypothetical protein